MSIPACLHSLVDDAAIFPPGNVPLDAGGRRAPRAPRQRVRRPGRRLRGQRHQVPTSPTWYDADDGTPPRQPRRHRWRRRGRARRHLGSRAPVLELRAIEVALRDEDDLAHNARFLAAVWTALSTEPARTSTVYVEPPRWAVAPTHGWLAALDELAARELRLKFRTGGVDRRGVPVRGRAGRASTRPWTARLPFKCTAGLHHAVGTTTATGFDHHGFLNVLPATGPASTAAADAVAAVLDGDHGGGPGRAVAYEPDQATAHPALVHLVRQLQHPRGPRRPGRARPAAGRCSWVPGAAGSPFDVDNLPYGVFSPAGRPAGRRPDRRLCSTSAPPARPPRLDSAAASHADPEPLMPGRRPGRARDWLAELLSDEGTRRTSRSWCRWTDVTCSCRSRSPTTSTSTPPSSTPPTSAGCSARTATPHSQLEAPADRLPRPSRHSRGQRHRRRTAEGQRPARRGRPPAFGPSRRLDIEAELGFVVGGPRAGPLGAPVGVRRPRLRGDPAQRLVGPRHPGLGVRAAGPVPGQVVRHLDQPWITPLAALEAARVAAARAGPAAARLPGGRRAGRLRHRLRGGAQRRGGQPAAVRRDVLVARPDARAPDRERRLAAHRRPVRAPGPSAATSGTSAGRSWSCLPGAAPSRSPPAAASAPSSRTATR